MKSFSLKSRWIAPSRALFPSLSPQDKLKFHDKVEFPSGYSPPNFYNQLLIYSLEIFKQVFKFFFFFEKKILGALFSFFSLSSARGTISPRKSPRRSTQIELPLPFISTRSMFILQSSKFSIPCFFFWWIEAWSDTRIFVKLYCLFINNGTVSARCDVSNERHIRNVVEGGKKRRKIRGKWQDGLM